MKTRTIILIAIAVAIILYFVYGKAATAAKINSLTAGYLMPENMTPLDVSGGLFPSGNNYPSATQATRILEATNAIRPLDENGNPSENGKIGFVACGASNPVKEWNAFTSLALASDNINPDLDFVNACIGAVSIEDMNSGTSPVGDYFARVINACAQEGLTPEQVQAIWFKSDCLTEDLWSMTEEEYVSYFADQVTALLQKMLITFPNLQIVYTSGRNYPFIDDTSDIYTRHGGPRAYFNQLGYREVMNRQTAGNVELIAYGSDKIAPVLTWSTPLYTYPHGTPNSYGHVWEESDVIGDGLHPTLSGEDKVADLLYTFFSTDEQAQKWFLV